MRWNEETEEHLSLSRALSLSLVLSLPRALSLAATFYVALFSARVLLRSVPASHSHVVCRQLTLNPTTTTLPPWLGTKAAMLPPDAPMSNYVGRSKVYLPYSLYTAPMEEYPVSIIAGDNLSFPRKR